MSFGGASGGAPMRQGSGVLEVGCGHGAMSIDLAQRGATVLGEDFDEGRIDFARRDLTDRFQELSSRVSLAAVDATTLPQVEQYDLIVSKDTFEHVEDVGTLLARLGALMKADSIAYIGFSPLHYSPFGDHGRSGLKAPWAHAIMPRRLVRTAAARHHGRPVNSLTHIGLNSHTPQEFRAAFRASSLTLLDIRYNQGDKPLLKTLRKIVACIVALEQFTTVSIYEPKRMKANERSRIAVCCAPPLPRCPSMAMTPTSRDARISYTSVLIQDTKPLMDSLCATFVASGT